MFADLLEARISGTSAKSFEAFRTLQRDLYDTQYFFERGEMLFATALVIQIDAKESVEEHGELSIHLVEYGGLGLRPEVVSKQVGLEGRSFRCGGTSPEDYGGFGIHHLNTTQIRCGVLRPLRNCSGSRRPTTSDGILHAPTTEG